jgi:uncharacterized protein (DUF2384 family)
MTHDEQVRRVAKELEIRPREVESVIESIGEHDGQLRPEVLSRFIRMKNRLERQLGGQASLRMWLKRKNLSLDNRTPIELLAEGRLDVLERVEQALEAVQFG